MGDTLGFVHVAITMLRYVPFVLVILLPEVFSKRRLLKLLSVVLFLYWRTTSGFFDAFLKWLLTVDLIS